VIVQRVVSLVLMLVGVGLGLLLPRPWLDAPPPAAAAKETTYVCPPFVLTSDPSDYVQLVVANQGSSTTSFNAFAWNRAGELKTQNASSSLKPNGVYVKLGETVSKLSDFWGFLTVSSPSQALSVSYQAILAGTYSVVPCSKVAR
jgi:hypothetical protein